MLTEADRPLLSGAYVDLERLLTLRFRGARERHSRQRRTGSHAGARLSRLRGRGIDFAEVRLYQAGDDVRAIDWRVTARKNKPHTKVFREERERPTLVVVDQSQSLFFGSKVRLKSVAAAEVAARAAWQALAQNDRVGGIAIGNAGALMHKPRRSARRVARLLGDVAALNQALTRQGDAPGTPLLNGLEQLHRLARSGHRIFLISDFQVALSDLELPLTRLARGNTVKAVFLYDALERDLPPPGEYTVTDGRGRWQFDAGNRQLRTRYRDQFDRRLAALETACVNRGIGFWAQATDDPIGPLLAWLR